MKNRLIQVPIFIYEDYVDYLQAWHNYARRFGLTQRDFLEKAGINAQAFLSDVLSGRKNIGRKHIAGFIQALNITGDEAEYFKNLALKEIVNNPGELEEIIKELSRLRENNLSSFLENRTLEYFTSWKYPVIREYIAARKVVGSPKEIVQGLLTLKLTSREVEQVLKKLLKWGMIVFDQETGGYRLNPDGEKVIQYKTIPHAIVNDVKRKMIETAVHAMETMDKEDRHVSMTLQGVSYKKYEWLCEKINEFRKEFLENTDDQDEPDRVIALNIQVFPVMKLPVGNNDAGGHTTDE